MGVLRLLPSRPAGSSSATVNTTRRAAASFRYPPLNLFLKDVALIIHNLPYALGIIMPMIPSTNPKGELYLSSFGNVFSIFVHAILFCIGIGSFALIPLFFVMPGGVWLFWCGVCTLAVAVLTMPLNRRVELVQSKGKYVDAGIQGEKWLFVNGVMCGKWWAQCAVDELERRFCRQITGIHNRTFGVVFDIVQCLIQRDLGYTTRCVRDTYQEIRKELLLKNTTGKDWKHKKVIVIAHSQGGLILSLVLDMLYADLADEVVGRLEIFTFGCAANHFNNPPNTYNPGQANATRTPTIKHIEHYANEYDFVARFGVLAYRPDTKETIPSNTNGAAGSFLTWDSISRGSSVHTAGDGDGENQFSGKIFLRQGGSGHQFVQHYVNGMFGGTHANDGRNGETVFVERDVSATRNGNGNAYMKNGTGHVNGGVGNGYSDGVHDGHSNENGNGCPQDEASLGELSRLWGYRGGRIQN